VRLKSSRNQIQIIHTYFVLELSSDRCLWTVSKWYVPGPSKRSGKHTHTHTKHRGRRNEGRERRNKSTRRGSTATTQQPQQHTAASTLHNKSKRRRRDGHRRSVRIGCSLYLSTPAGIRRFPLSLTQATFSASWSLPSWFAALPQSLVLGIAGATRFLVLLRWV